MRAIFTCGGTGGHINPALAIAKLLRERRPESEILFVGAERGLETSLVPMDSFKIVTVDISSLRRSLSPGAISHNIQTAMKMSASVRRAKEIIADFRPDIVVGTGGYASFPVVYAASKLKIPTAIHESNAVFGLTTKLLSGRATKVMLSFRESLAQCPDQARAVVTGMPVKNDFILADRKNARRELSLLEGEKLIVSFWGSLGARDMNRIIADFIKLETELRGFKHIHATGGRGYEWMPAYLRDSGVDLEKHQQIDMREYIYDMPRAMAAADLVLCRGGASTIGELCAQAKPSIIVPSPNVADNHQEKNARVLEKNGAAEVILESECTGEKLFGRAMELISDKEQLSKMSNAAADMAILDATQRIYDEITSMVKIG